MKTTFTAENHYKTKTEAERAEAVTKAVEKMINQKLNEKN